MIHEIIRELNEGLRALGCPFPVYDREDTKTTAWARERIVVENDGDDRFGPVRGVHTRQRHVCTQTSSYKATIYAQSPSAGATEWEHRRRAQRVLNTFLAVLNTIGSKRHNEWTPVRGRFLVPDDLEGSAAHGGAVYELAFTFDRGVVFESFKGEGPETFSLPGGMVKSTTKVSMRGGVDDDDNPNTPPADAETACGGS